MRILIIEDDVEIKERLVKNLSNDGFIIDTVEDGNQGSYIARTNQYNLILLDYLLPSKNGFDVCKEIRSAGVHTPIIIMTVNKSTEDKVSLLEAGADDYITKPFSYQELLARIKAVTRRPYHIQNSSYSLDDLTIHIDLKEVTKSGERIYLTRKEYTLLECMARKPGKIITRSEILEEAWGYDTDPFSNTIEAHIRNIRKKIGETKSRKYIQTVPGRGYKLDRTR